MDANSYRSIIIQALRDALIMQGDEGIVRPLPRGYIEDKWTEPNVQQLPNSTTSNMPIYDPDITSSTLDRGLSYMHPDEET